MQLDVEVNTRYAAWRETLPDAEQLCARAVRAALDGTAAEGAPAIEVSVVLGNDRFVKELNRDYRGRDKPTNVLSFPSKDAAATDTRKTGPLLLGDIVLAYETVLREAQSRGVSIGDHASHLVVHGALHLLGYDHEDDDEAAEMERLESGILFGLGIADPYRAKPIGAAEF